MQYRPHWEIKKLEEKGISLKIIRQAADLGENHKEQDTDKSNKDNKKYLHRLSVTPFLLSTHSHTSQIPQQVYHWGKHIGTSPDSKPPVHDAPTPPNMYTSKCPSLAHDISTNKMHPEPSGQHTKPAKQPTIYLQPWQTRYAHSALSHRLMWRKRVYQFLDHPKKS